MHGQGDSFLDGILAGGAPKAEPDAEDGELLPDPKAPYQAHSRAANKPASSLHCLLGAEGCRSFQFVQLDSNSESRAAEQGQLIRPRFAGTKIWEITIGGLNLWRLYDLLHRHQVAWVRQSDRGFPTGRDGEPLIQAIPIKEIEREG